MDENVEVNSEFAEVAPVETHNHESQPEIAPIESKQDRNWRAIRQRNAELEQKIKLQEEMMAQVLAASQHVSNTQVIAEPDEPDDDIPTNGKVKKFAKKEIEPLNKRTEQLEKELNQLKQQQFLNNLRRQYSDFDEVVNPETLALLEEKDPELAETIAKHKDPYTIGLQSYKFIKSMNLLNKVPESRHAREVEKKLEQNAKTVQSPLVYDKRPLAQAFNYADVSKNKALQEELYKEMYESASRAGFGY